MSRVETLCANAQYQASLMQFYVKKDKGQLTGLSKKDSRMMISREGGEGIVSSGRERRVNT